MATDPVTALTPAGQLAANSTPGTKQLSSGSSTDFDRFLKLLTAQMQYQNPLDPTDPTQFVAQLAQFSQVEQQTKTNSLLTGIAASLSTGGSLVENAALLGKSVQTVLSAITVPANGEVSASLSFSNTQLKNLRFEVLDANGMVLRQMPLKATDTKVTFDGRDSSGMRLTPGSYGVRVVGDDETGARKPAGSLGSTGVIKEVRSDGEGQFSLLLDNGLIVKAADITRLGV